VRVLNIPSTFSVLQNAELAVSNLTQEYGTMNAVSLALACTPSFGVALSTRRAQA